MEIHCEVVKGTELAWEWVQWQAFVMKSNKPSDLMLSFPKILSWVNVTKEESNEHICDVL
jgi:hypothetical protein